MARPRLHSVDRTAAERMRASRAAARVRDGRGVRVMLPPAAAADLAAIRTSAGDPTDADTVARLLAAERERIG